MELWRSAGRRWQASGRRRLGEAALGAIVRVSLPDGRALRVRVPAHAQGGCTLRIEGQGWPGKPPGDLEFVLRIMLPSAYDPRARRHYEAKAAKLTDIDARRVAAAESSDREREESWR